jgi:hypothetical protein
LIICFLGGVVLDLGGGFSSLWTCLENCVLELLGKPPYGSGFGSLKFGALRVEGVAKPKVPLSSVGGPLYITTPSGLTDLSLHGPVHHSIYGGFSSNLGSSLGYRLSKVHGTSLRGEPTITFYVNLFILVLFLGGTLMMFPLDLFEASYYVVLAKLLIRR